MRAVGDSRASVVSVHASDVHGFSKEPRASISLIEGFGVEGDAHAGATVQHRSRVAKNPAAPNLRQVHLLDDERLAALRALGFDVWPGALGENITTQRIDPTALRADATLSFPGGSVVRITGLRNPCRQLDRFASGLMAELRFESPAGTVQRLAGVMGVVVESGPVAAGDRITVAQASGGRVLAVV